MSLIPLCSFAQLAEEDFEGTWPPAGWTIDDNGIGPAALWTQSQLGNPLQPPYEGDYAAYVNKENVASGIPEDWLITPQFTVPTNPQLHFFSRLTQPGDQGSLYRIMVTTGDPTDLAGYDQVEEWTEFEINPVQDDYVEVALDIPAAYEGQDVYLAFVLVGDNGDRWLIDNVSVLQQCLEPTDLDTDSIGLDTANLTWTDPNGASEWEIEVVEALDIPSGSGEVYSGTLPYEATGLTESTDYKYYVRTICDDGGTSEWAGPFYFSTVALGATCDAAIEITSLPYTTTDNTDGYGDDYSGSPGASGCGSTSGYLNGDDVVYEYTAAADGTINIDMTENGSYSGMFVYEDCADIGVACVAGGVGGFAGNPVSIENFAVTAGQTYYIVISTWASPQTAPYTLTIQQVFCEAPDNLSASGVDNDSAELSWGNPSGATSWEIVVQEAGGGLPAGAGTTVASNSNYPATGLDEATAYEFYVRADCNDGNFSVWAGPFLFSTTQVPATMDYSQDFEGTANWSLGNGDATNQWVIGTAISNSPTTALYISNDGGATTNYTNNSTSVVHAYRDIQMPAAVDQLALNFDWLADGENCCDYLRVWIVPGSFTPTEGTLIGAGTNRIQIGGNYNDNSDWETVTEIFDGSAYAGEVLRLVFEWRNDGSVGTPPGAAVDNIGLSVVTCPSPSDLDITDLQEDEATFEWTGPTSVSPTFDYYFATDATAPDDATTPTGNVADETVTIGSLPPSTPYWFWVRSNCGPGDTSFWVGPVQFTTPQVPAVLDYEDDFEGAVNWTLVNGDATNQWFVGTATSSSPDTALYITNDGGVSNAYTNNSASIVHAYRDIQMPAAVDQLLLSYDWKANAQGCCDFLRVWMVPVTYSPAEGTQITAAADRIQIGGNHNLQSDWQTENEVIEAADFSGQIVRLIFEWTNNAFTGTNPPAAVDNVDLSVITCPAPTDLAITDLQDEEATFEWTGPTSVSPTFDYYFTTSPDTPDDTTVPTDNVADETVTIGSLPPSTAYWFWVRSNCGPGDTSFWVGPVQFTTPQVPAELDFEDDFEDTISWTLSNGDQTNQWYFGTATSSSPDTSLYISNDGGANNTYTNNVSSVVHAYRDLAIPATGVEANLSFDWKAQAENCCDYVRVWMVPVTYSPTPGTLITAAADRVQVGGNYNNNSDWQTVNEIVDVSSFAGQTLRLIFEWRNDGSVGTAPAGAIDNVALSLITCPQPIDLAVSDVSNDSVVLEWTETGSATAWEVYVVNAGDPAPDDTTVGTAADTNPFTYDGLGAGLSYEYYVRSVCDTDDMSLWSGPYSFNTTFCPLDDQCVYEFIMVDSWGDGWNGNTMTVYQGGIAIAELTGPTAADDTNPVSQFVNICPGVPLELYWNSGGFSAGEVGVSIENAQNEEIFNHPTGSGAQNSLLYEGIPNCDPITCPQPTDLLSENYGIDGVELTWTPGGTETEWEVVIQVADNGYPGENPTTVISVEDEPSYIVTGLNPDLFYEYYVRAICGEGDESFWSGPYEFSIFSPPGCAAIDVFEGADLDVVAPDSEINICPGDDNCFDFSANYYELKETDSYEVESIAYNPPYPFLGGTELNIETDDIWSPVVDLPFDFCFYGGTFNQAKVGSNGVVQLGNNMTNGGFCPWSYDESVPDPAFPILNAIYGVYQDVNPNVDGSDVNINYQVLGSYPCRALVVNYYDVPQFSCGLGVGTQTSQIVIYEISNIIEVYVETRTPCTTWQGGVGVIGIQNADGTEGITPADRNTGAWTATNEAWRFVPSGDNLSVVFEWLKDGEFYSSDSDITLCATEQTSLTARATYTACTGEEIVKENNITINVNEPITPEEPQDLNACIDEGTNEGTFDLTESLVGMFPDLSEYNFMFYDSQDAADIGDDDNLPETYTTDTEQTIYIRITRGNNNTCYVTESFDLFINEAPDADAPDDVLVCSDDANPYVLPALTNGNYFSEPGGTGTAYAAGDTFTIPDGVNETTYTLYVYAESGTTPNCTVDNEFTITLVRTPNIAPQSDVTECDSYTLPALSAGLSYYTDVDGPNGAGTMLNAGDEITTTQTIYVYGENIASTDASFVCFSEESFEVTIIDSPVAQVLPDVTECDSYELPALDPDNNYYTGPDGTGDMLAAGDLITTTQTIYILADTDPISACTDESSFVVTITPNPDFNLGGPYTACVASNVTIAVNANNFNTADATYAWTVNGVASAETGSSIQGTEFGTYEVTVTVNNCSATESIALTQDTDAVAIMFEEGCEDGIYMVNVMDIDGSFNPDTASYTWTGPNGFSETTQEVVIPEAGDYTVTVTTEDGCIGSTVVNVIDTSCSIPRGISPNNDDMNDTFDLTSLGVTQISIFNRYGKEVFSYGAYTDQWHGQSSEGDELPTGTYFYSIKRANGESKTGWVYINREQ
ncbi:hypothetical protein GCM10007424_24360 [Flavobacterium suaedae]|uniref:Fibronectin type-III domain-containing protein n=2 Tax=Flavobacterium suaedae TaxID=1767027 RepID=A0ABQ1JZR6_9FLAO|nr:hypothetical protein GCM10007424_24360 [Flavobacterium suaedae]